MSVVQQRTNVMLVGLAALALTAACDNTVPAWQLDNDRIIAVRATPPGLLAGERARLDVLVTAQGVGPQVISPQLAIAVPSDAAMVEVPEALRAAVAPEGGGWRVTAPSEPELAQLRGSLGLSADAPVPLRVGVRVELGGAPFDAVKTVMLGEARANPALGAVTVGGAAPADGLIVPVEEDVELRVEVAETEEVLWLTSVGELSDQDDPVATLRRPKDSEDPVDGHVSVVVRDGEGGVTWGFWTASVAP